MKKERFKEIVSNYSSTSDEVKSLKKLAHDYPFSQIIHLLLANASKTNNSHDYKPSLTNAAFYTTDRSILKSLIENNLVPSDIDSGILSLKLPKKQIGSSSQPKAIISATTTNSNQLVDDVLKNLEKLQKVKKEAAVWLENRVEDKAKKEKVTTKKPAVKLKPKKKAAKPNAQSKIIEKFIKEEPRITKKSKPVNEKQDMAVKSGKMRDDVISESLAKIFVKQGKIEKAIDIYKKLIWKFPQKKTLFAARIEKLKKK